MCGAAVRRSTGMLDMYRLAGDKLCALDTARLMKAVRVNHGARSRPCAHCYLVSPGPVSRFEIVAVVRLSLSFCARVKIEGQFQNCSCRGLKMYPV